MFVDEGVSGKVQDRVGLGQAIRALRRGDVLVVARLDRLARDLITQELLLRELWAKGVTVESCQGGENAYLAQGSDDPSRTMVRQILGAVAEYERAIITLRTQAGKLAKQRNGGYAGGQPPYGYKGGMGVLTEVPSEQATLELMRLFETHGFDYATIAVNLNLQGHVRRNGMPWNRTMVRQVLQRGTPAGAVGQDSGREVAREVGDEEVAPGVLEGDGREHG
jgi:DNA invertase Pin-like site-specific DNA recombinase